MQITFKHFCEALDTVHPHKRVSDEYDENFDIARDENDRPIGITARKLTHQFKDPHSGDTINVMHDIKHHTDDYSPDPKKAPRTTIEVAFSRSPGEGSSEETVGRVHAGKAALGIFGTVGAITKKVVDKYGHGETTVTAEAENNRVPAYSRMMKRHVGTEPDVTEYPDNHPGAGNSNLSFVIPKKDLSEQEARLVDAKKLKPERGLAGQPVEFHHEFDGPEDSTIRVISKLTKDDAGKKNVHVGFTSRGGEGGPWETTGKGGAKQIFGQVSDVVKGITDRHKVDSVSWDVVGGRDGTRDKRARIYSKLAQRATGNIPKLTGTIAGKVDVTKKDQ